MVTNEDKKRFLEELQKTPVVQVACQKTGMGRTTYYRFRKGDKKFAQLADLALQEGRAVVNDLGEAQTISLMKDRDMNAIRFWLTHNEPRYGNKLEITGRFMHSTEKLTPEQSKLLRQAIKLALPNKKDGHEKVKEEQSEETTKEENEEV